MNWFEIHYKHYNKQKILNSFGDTKSRHWSHESLKSEKKMQLHKDLKYKRRPDLERENMHIVIVDIKGHSKIQSQTFINDAALMWNNAPSAIKDCKTIGSVKKQIKIFIQSLPI